MSAVKLRYGEIALIRDVLFVLVVGSLGVYFLYCTVYCIIKLYSPNEIVVLKQYNTDITFVGGMPRSGTTLMRAMLDAHPEVRCGQETRVIPQVLYELDLMLQNRRESESLTEAKVLDVLDSAVKAFILDIVTKHGEPAPHLCNKDPFVLRYTSYLSRLFPSSMYILMLRDGRAVVHSIISRQISIGTFDWNSYRVGLSIWNEVVEYMYEECKRVGPNRCMPVYYEQLVLNPEVWMRKILSFLNISWSDSVLHHQDFVGKTGGIKLSRSERSTDQVKEALNPAALTKWVGHIPDDVLEYMPDIAPMLLTLGYNPWDNPPNYQLLPQTPTL